jgi:hypothetical protein
MTPSVQLSPTDYVLLPSTQLAQDTPGQALEESALQGAFKTAGIRGLLPNALAKEERMVRLNEARVRRRDGIELTAQEIREDLSKIMSHLITQLSMHGAGVSVILKLPVQALLYVERTASYAIKDYPRIFEGDSAITGLWDVLERIHIAAADWRKEEPKRDERALIVSIERMAKAAMRSLPVVGDEDTTHEEQEPSEGPES